MGRCGWCAVVAFKKKTPKQTTQQAVAECGWVAFDEVVVVFRGRRPAAGADKQNETSTGRLRVVRLRSGIFLRRRKESPPQAPNKNRIRTTRIRTY